jgi:hypothetical protein
MSTEIAQKFCCLAVNIHYVDWLFQSEGRLPSMSPGGETFPVADEKWVDNQRELPQILLKSGTI